MSLHYETVNNKTLYATNRDDWQAWLKKNHDTGKEAWLIFYKKHTGKPSIPYDDAVEEALCFGWIDSTVKRIDDERYAKKFTSRKDNSIWSEMNKKRVEKMIKEGRMTEAGMAKINTGGFKTNPIKKVFVIPAYLKEAFSSDKKVWDNFNNLAPSYKRMYIGWVADAKKKETREKRIKEAIGLLKQNKKLGMK